MATYNYKQLVNQVKSEVSGIIQGGLNEIDFNTIFRDTIGKLNIDLKDFVDIDPKKLTDLLSKSIAMAFKNVNIDSLEKINPLSSIFSGYEDYSKDLRDVEKELKRIIDLREDLLDAQSRGTGDVNNTKQIHDLERQFVALTTYAQNMGEEFKKFKNDIEDEYAELITNSGLSDIVVMTNDYIQQLKKFDETVDKLKSKTTSEITNDLEDKIDEMRNGLARGEIGFKKALDEISSRMKFNDNKIVFDDDIESLKKVNAELSKEIDIIKERNKILSSSYDANKALLQGFGKGKNFISELPNEVSKLDEQLKQILIDSKIIKEDSEQLQKISSGNTNKGGFIGDDIVAIFRDTKFLNNSELMKKKLDEAYYAGANVARILDVVKEKGSQTFVEIQEKAQGSILGNDFEFINPEFLDATDEEIKKFAEDFKLLNDLNIGVDLSLNNILYKKGQGFWFIDLDAQATSFEDAVADFVGRVDKSGESLGGTSEIIKTTLGVDSKDLSKVDSFFAKFSSYVQKGAESLVDTAEEATAKAQKSHSPSKLAEVLGEYWGIGYANGIKKHADDVEDAIRQLVTSGLKIGDKLVKFSSKELQRDWQENIMDDDQYEALNNALLNLSFSDIFNDNPTEAQQEISKLAQLLTESFGENILNSLDRYHTQIKDKIIELFNVGKLSNNDLKNVEDELTYYVDAALLSQDPESNKAYGWLLAAQHFYESKKNTGELNKSKDKLPEFGFLLKDGYQYGDVVQGDRNLKMPSVPSGEKGMSFLHTHPYSPDVNNLRFSEKDIATILSSELESAILMCGQELLKIDFSDISGDTKAQMKADIEAVYLGIMSHLGGTISATEKGGITSSHIDELPLDLQNKAADLINGMLFNILSQYGGVMSFYDLETMKEIDGLKGVSDTDFNAINEFVNIIKTSKTPVEDITTRQNKSIQNTDDVAIQKENEELKAQLSKSDEVLSATISSRNSERLEYEEQISQLQQDLDDAKKANESFVESNKDLIPKEEYDKLKNIVDELQSLKNEAEDMSKVKNENQSLINQLNELNEKLQNALVRIEEVKSEAAKKIAAPVEYKTINSKNAPIVSLSPDAEIIEHTIQKTKDEIVESDKKDVQIIAKQSEAQKTISEELVTIADVKKKILEYDLAISEANSKIAKDQGLISGGGSYLERYFEKKEKYQNYSNEDLLAKINESFTEDGKNLSNIDNMQFTWAKRMALINLYNEKNPDNPFSFKGKKLMTQKEGQAFYEPMRQEIQVIENAQKELKELQKQLVNYRNSKLALTKQLEAMERKKNAGTEVNSIMNDLSESINKPKPNKNKMSKDDMVKAMMSSKQKPVSEAKEGKTKEASEITDFSGLEGKIKTDIPAAIEVKNKAFKDEQTLVKSVVDSEIKDFSALETKIKTDIPAAVETKNKAFIVDNDSVNNAISQLDKIEQKLDSIEAKNNIEIAINSNIPQDKSDVTIQPKTEDSAKKTKEKRINLNVAKPEITPAISDEIKEKTDAIRFKKYQDEIVKSIDGITYFYDSNGNLMKSLIKTTEMVDGILSKVATTTSFYNDKDGAGKVATSHIITDDFESTERYYIKQEQEFSKQLLNELHKEQDAINMSRIEGEAQEAGIKAKRKDYQDFAKDEFDRLIARQDEAYELLDRATSEWESWIKETFNTTGKVREVALEELQKAIDNLLDAREAVRKAGGDLSKNNQHISDVNKSVGYKKIKTDQKDKLAKNKQIQNDTYKNLEEAVRNYIYWNKKFKMSSGKAQESAFEQALKYQELIDKYQKYLDRSNMRDQAKNDSIKQRLSDMEAEIKINKENQKAAKEARSQKETEKNLEKKINESVQKRIKYFKQIQKIQKQINQYGETPELIAEKQEAQQKYNEETKNYSKLTGWTRGEDPAFKAVLDEANMANTEAKIKQRKQYVDEVEKQQQRLREVLESAKTMKSFKGREEYEPMLSDSNLSKNDVDTALDKIANNAYAKVGDKLSVLKIIQKAEETVRKYDGMPEELKTRYNELIDIAKQAAKAEQVSVGEVKDFASTLSKLDAALNKSGKKTSSFFSEFASRLKGINAQFLAQYFSIQDWIRYLRQAVSVITELDTALTEMRKVSNETLTSLKQYQGLTFDIASEIGTTSVALQNSTADWMRLGESLEDAAESAKTATILMNVSEFESIDDATTSLVAMSQAYKELSKGEIVDVVNKVGNEFSISTKGLAEALQSSAAVLYTQGNNLAEAVALITAGKKLPEYIVIYI